MTTRWTGYIVDGTFSLSVPKDTPLGGKGGKGRSAEFWTTPYPYWDMQERDRELWDDLRNSSLVIFKVRKNTRFLRVHMKATRTDLSLFLLFVG